MRTRIALVVVGLVLAGCKEGERGAFAPTLAPGAACPTSHGRVVNEAYGPAFGPGPVYAAAVSNGGVVEISPPENFQSHDWAGQKVLWVIDKTYEGPVEIRGRRLDGEGIVRFDRGDVPPDEIRIGAGGGGYVWRNRPSYTRVEGPGCYAWDVEGNGFSYSIVFLARRLTD